MKYRDLIVKRQGSLLTVELNRAESLNTLSVRMLRELKEVALSFNNDPGIRVVILTGASRMFTAGLDLKDPEVKKMLSGTLDERRELVVLGPHACQAWQDTTPVTIAAIEGLCVGGGVSVVISCDFRIMAQSAFMRIPEIELGLNYSWGSIPRLLHLIGPSRTKEMILLGEKVVAKKCLAWGLAGKVVADGSALKAAIALGEKIVKKPSIPVSMTKQAITNITAALDRVGIYMDADQFLLTTYSKDHKEGVKAFLEKRSPRFKGR
jgi:enoyl-CoA hydratase